MVTCNQESVLPVPWRQHHLFKSTPSTSADIKEERDFSFFTFLTRDLLFEQHLAVFYGLWCFFFKVIFKTSLCKNHGQGQETLPLLRAGGMSPGHVEVSVEAWPSPSRLRQNVHPSQRVRFFSSHPNTPRLPKLCAPVPPVCLSLGGVTPAGGPHSRQVWNGEIWVPRPS